MYGTDQRKWGELLPGIFRIFSKLKEWKVLMYAFRQFKEG
jgi:hypothetical protein